MNVEKIRVQVRSYIDKVGGHRVRISSKTKVALDRYNNLQCYITVTGSAKTKERKSIVPLESVSAKAQYSKDNCYNTKKSVGKSQYTYVTNIIVLGIHLVTLV